MSSRSSAWPLAGIWAALIVYASLHPFAGWRWPAVLDTAGWTALVWPPMPHYSSPFDLGSNYLGYLPIGLLLAIGFLRADWRPWLAGLSALLLAGLLSWSMETLQHLLPRRYPSRIDLAMNSAGAGTGALLALAAARLGWLRHWQQLRDQWFVPHGTAGLALLLSWPVGLLFPPPLPLALGQGLGRLMEAITDTLADSTLAIWLPLPTPHGQLAPLLELISTTLGALAPCFVAYIMSRRPRHRIVLMLGSLGLGLVATTLSTALNFSPEYALAWLTPPTRPALATALVLGVAMAWLPRRAVAAIGLLAINSLIALVSQIAPDPYFADSLQGWEQGRFIRFHGLAQWVGWLWPFAAMTFLLAHLIDVPAPARRADTPRTPTIDP
ncbi:VanZ family protein [Sphaerotilus hippei]|uniref:VanZ family protein n=1 Tax=Sphaerotilus hippei TaxID=744406 RepID=A0A318HDG4_9BURK|nr:VanZ family protein [Sphaerotilus hippei]PXW99259.1 VanZ family protein [Sphaerotilus hippei]